MSPRRPALRRAALAGPGHAEVVALQEDRPEEGFDELWPVPIVLFSRAGWLRRPLVAGIVERAREHRRPVPVEGASQSALDPLQAERLAPGQPVAHLLQERCGFAAFGLADLRAEFFLDSAAAWRVSATVISTNSPASCSKRRRPSIASWRASACPART